MSVMCVECKRVLDTKKNSVYINGWACYVCYKCHRKARGKVDDKKYRAGKW